MLVGYAIFIDKSDSQLEINDNPERFTNPEKHTGNTKRNDIEPVSKRDSMNLSIEMETGTVKTCVYLRTIYELNQQYSQLPCDIFKSLTPPFFSSSL